MLPIFVGLLLQKHGVDLEISFAGTTYDRGIDGVSYFVSALLQESWVGAVITDAHADLHSPRKQEQQDAGGLIVAMNQDYVRKVAGPVEVSLVAFHMWPCPTIHRRQRRS